MVVLLMDFHGCNYTHIRKQMQWEEELTGGWDLTKCVIQEAIKMENHCSSDKQGHNMLGVNHSISLKAKVTDLPSQCKKWAHTWSRSSLVKEAEILVWMSRPAGHQCFQAHVSPTFLHGISPPKSSWRKEAGGEGEGRMDGRQAQKGPTYGLGLFETSVFSAQGKAKPTMPWWPDQMV